MQWSVESRQDLNPAQEEFCVKTRQAWTLLYQDTMIISLMAFLNSSTFSCLQHMSTTWAGATH